MLCVSTKLPELKLNNPFTPLPPQTVSDGDIVIAFTADRLLTRLLPDGSQRLPERHEVPQDEAVAIGTISGALCAAVMLPEPLPGTPAEDWREMRSALQALSRAERMAASRAVELLRWRNRRQYCGLCGCVTVDDGTECARRCSGCGALFFPVIAPAVITLIHRDDRILLAHNRKFAGNIHSLIAGFVEAGESAEDAVRREIREEVGLEIKNLQYKYSQSWPFPDSLMMGFTAEYESGDLQVDGEEIAEADFYSIDELPELPNHGSIARRIIEEYVAEMKNSAR